MLVIFKLGAKGGKASGEARRKRKLIRECLNEMLQCVAAILAPQDSFMVLNLYSNGYSAVLGETIVKQAFCLKNAYKSLDFGELVLRDSYGKNLPLSVFVRLAR